MHVILRNGTHTVPATLGRVLGEGSTGRIYEVGGRPDLVAKVYLDPATRSPSARLGKAHFDRIDAMVRNPPKVGSPHQEGGHRFHQLAWPTDHLIAPSGEPLGYAMPRLPLERACDLEAILTRRSRAREGLPQELRVRLYVARNVAAVVRELHKSGHYVVDMKPKNMSVYRIATPGLIALLDADGFSIDGGRNKRFPAEMFTSEYIAPELLASGKKPSDASEEQDRWALAVIIFRLLNENIHPYSGRSRGAGNATIDENVRHWRYAYGRTPHTELEPNPLSIHEFFEDDTRELFERAFGRDPSARPSAREWRDHLDQFTTTSHSRLIQCRADPIHWHYSKGCGQCHREKLIGGRTTQITVPSWGSGMARATAPPIHVSAAPSPSTPLRSIAARRARPFTTLLVPALGLAALFFFYLFAKNTTPNDSAAGPPNAGARPSPAPSSERPVSPPPADSASTESNEPKRADDDEFRRSMQQSHQEYTANRLERDAYEAYLARALDDGRSSAPASSEPPGDAGRTGLPSLPPQTVASVPAVKVGDSYTIESTSLGQDVATTVVERRVVSVDAGLLTVLSRNARNQSAKARTLRFTPEWNLVSTRNADGSGTDYAPPLQYFSFPLYPGKTWRQTSTETDLQTGAQREFRFSANVGEWEDVSVLGRTFRAIKVTIGTEVIETSTGKRATGLDVSWYAPEVRRSIKSTVTSHDPAGREETREMRVTAYELR